ncbi:RecT family recombinase [Pantoea ananatis]
MNMQTNHPVEQGAVTNSNVALFDSQYLRAINEFATVMANGVATVPQHLQGNPADCMAVAMQAAQWQMNPFAVAQKTHLINGVLGYEAQLVNAVIVRSGILTTRFEYEWYGPWEKIIGKFAIKKNDKGKEYRVPDWRMSDEEGIGIRISATLRGESEPRVLDLLLAQARVRNSTLWAEDPRQQLAYLGVKRWARLYCPDVILGVYTPDELEERHEREVFSAPDNRVSLAALSSTEQITPADDVTTLETSEQVNPVANAAEQFRLDILNAESPAVAQTLRGEIEKAKGSLGTALFVELKNRAVARYHQLTAIEKLNQAINELPKPGADGASDAFAALERLYTTSKRHLGAELEEQYSVTLADMKPEYAA